LQAYLNIIMWHLRQTILFYTMVDNNYTFRNQTNWWK